MIRYMLLVLIAVAAPAIAVDELPVGVRNALQVRQVPPDTLSIYVEDLESGEVVLAWNAEVPRNPASTMKLLTTLVALDVLGPAYRWKTDVFARGEIRDGRLDGDLLLKGYGDPFLVTERVWQMLRRLQLEGVREIGGDLLLDDSWFDVGDYDPADFDNQPLRAYNVAPNALLLNFKVVRYWFEPDGSRVSVLVDPPLANLRVDNRLTVRQGYCGGYQRGIAVNMNDANDTVIFEGRFPSGCERYAMDRAALSHNEFAFGLLQALWTESGGVFPDTWKTALAEEGEEPLFTFESHSCPGYWPRKAWSADLRVSGSI